MRVIKVKNLTTSQYYFAKVEDSNGKRDPLNIFNDLLVDQGAAKMSNIDVEVVRKGLSREEATATIIGLRIKNKTDRNYIDTTKSTSKKAVVKKVAKKVKPVKVIEEQTEKTTSRPKRSDKTKTKKD